MRLFKRYLPDQKTIREHRQVRLLGTLLNDPNIWHWSRRSVPGALSIGFFCAWIPLPFQMILAAILAISFRVNLPISVALVWITNPLTIIPMFIFAYRLGVWMLGVPELERVEFTFDSIWELKQNFWYPFLIGCFFIGSVSGLSANLLARGIWRLQLVNYVRKRRERRKRRKLTEKSSEPREK